MLKHRHTHLAVRAADAGGQLAWNVVVRGMPITWSGGFDARRRDL